MARAPQCEEERRVCAQAGPSTLPIGNVDESCGPQITSSRTSVAPVAKNPFSKRDQCTTVKRAIKSQDIVYYCLSKFSDFAEQILITGRIGKNERINGEYKLIHVLHDGRPHYKSVNKDYYIRYFQLSTYNIDKEDLVQCCLVL